jgi:O-antigen/teichoic acid export membrane protein
MKASAKRSSALLNVLANWGAFICGAVVSFFLAPYIVHRLGDTVYGIWALVGSVTGYLGLLDLGVRSAVTRYLARYAAEGDTEGANRMASSALALFSVSGLIALLAAATLAAVMPIFFQLSPAYLTAARLAVLIGGATVGVSLFAGVFGGTIAGLQRFTMLSGVDVTLELIRAAAVWLSLGHGGGIVQLALIQLTVSLVRLTIYRQLCRRLLPWLRLSVASVGRDAIKTIISFSGYATLLHSSGMLILYSDSLVIGAMLPVTAVTFFAIGASLTEYARTVVSGISQTLTPMASAAQAVSPHEVSRLFRRSVRLGTLAVLPILVTFLVRGPTFIELWMGASYREASGSVLRLLTISLCFAASYQIVTATMMGLNRHRSMALIYLGEGVINLVLSLALARPLGIIGVALGTAIPRLIVSCYFGPGFAREVLQVSRTTFALDAWLRPLLAMVPFGLVSLAIDHYWKVGSLLVYFSQVALALPAAVLGAWFVSLEADERAAASTWVGRRWARLAGTAAS